MWRPSKSSGLHTSVMHQGLELPLLFMKEEGVSMFLLSVKTTSSSIVEMQKSKWPETLSMRRLIHLLISAGDWEGCRTIENKR